MLLEEVISRDFTLKGHGKWLRAVEHDSLVVNTEDQVFFWNSKGIYYGNIKDWFEKVKNRKFNESAFIEIIPETVVEEPVEVVQDPALVELFYQAGIKHRDYWHDKRGYTDKTIDRFRLGFSGDFYTIPIFENGTFVNFQCRKDNPKTVKHWYRGVGPHSFNLGILRYYDWVVLTEGPSDAIMLRQHEIPAVSQTSGAGDIRMYAQNFHRFHGIKNIFIVYDNDLAGNTGSQKVQGIFGSRAKIYNMWDFPQAYDITDFFKDGHTRKDFINLLDTNSKETLDE